MKTIFSIAATALFLAAPATQLGATHLNKAESAKAPASAPMQNTSQVDTSGVTASISQPESESFAAAAPAMPTTFGSSIAALVLEDTGNATDGDEAAAALVEATRAFYGSSNAAPIWIDETGPSQKARDAAIELRNAATYGLDPKAYDLPDMSPATTRGALARFELAMTRAVWKYAHQAKAGRVKPSNIGHKGNTPKSLDNPRAFLEGLASGGDVAASLRGLHPTHPQFIALKKRLAELRGAGDGAVRVQIPDGPVLRLGETHEQVALLRKRLDVGAAADGNSKKYDDALKSAVVRFQKARGLKGDGVVGAGTRKALNGDTNEREIVRVLINMERWRWLPDDLGEGTGIYVWTIIHSCI